MRARGRKSAADLAVVSPDGITTIRRPDPPGDLTDEQGHEWRSIVNRLPAEWFQRETHGLLAQYCRHVVAARRVAQLVEAMEAEEAQEGFSVVDYDRLLKMQEREGRAISSLATRMRISQQSTLDQAKRKPNKPSKRPWEAA